MIGLLLLVLLGLSLPLPQRLIVAVPLVVAGVESIRGLLAVGRRGASSRERLWPLVTLGLVGIMLMSVMTQLVFYGPQKAYEDCLSGANTEVAQAACQHDRQRSILGGLVQP